MEKLADETTFTPQDLLEPIDAPRYDLKTLNALTDILLRIIAYNPGYWKDYTNCLIYICFKDIKDQEYTLKQCLRCIEKAQSPSRELLDTIPKQLTPKSTWKTVYAAA